MPCETETKRSVNLDRRSSDRSAGPFAINGLVSLQRVHCPEWHAAYQELVPAADEFLALYARWGLGYPWPADPLHCWQRPFEYPYVLHNLPPVKAPRRPVVVDVGSAVTFFSLCLARRGYLLRCTDPDPRMLQFWNRVRACFAEEAEALSRWEYLISAPYVIPIDAAAADALTCVSVLEHVEDPPRLLEEMLRIVKPGGTLILTMDVSLESNLGVSAGHFNTLRDMLEKLCVPAYQAESVHPQDLIVWPAVPRGLVPAPWFPKKPQSWRARLLSPLQKYRVSPTPERSTCLFVGTYTRA